MHYIFTELLALYNSVQSVLIFFSFLIQSDFQGFKSLAENLAFDTILSGDGIYSHKQLWTAGMEISDLCHGEPVRIYLNVLSPISIKGESYYNPRLKPI